MNSEEIKRRAFIRQFVVSTVGVEGEASEETAIDSSIREKLEEHSEKKCSTSIDEHTEDFEATSIYPFVKKLKDLQDNRQRFPVEILSELDPMTEFAEMVQVQNDIEQPEIDELSCVPADSFKSINESTSDIIDHTFINTGILFTIENMTMRFGFTQLLHALKRIENMKAVHSTTTDMMIESEPIQLSSTDAPLQSIHDLERINEVYENERANRQMAVERLLKLLKQVKNIKKAISKNAEHVVHSQIEKDSIHNSTLKMSTSHFEMAVSKISHEDSGTDMAIEPYEENRKSKQMMMEQLIDLLKRVQLTKNDERIDNAFLQAEIVKTSDTPSACNGSNESIDIPVEDEHDALSESKQMAVERFVSLLKEIANQKEKRTQHTQIKMDDHDDETIKPLNQLLRSNAIHSKTTNIPFSTMIEVHDFLHAPLFGEVSQHTFEFVDPDNTKNIQMDTKFVSTTAHYLEQITCHLISSSIHEVLTVSNASQKNVQQHKNKPFKSNIIPLHSKQKKGESKRTEIEGDYKRIKVPFVVGEYCIEISMEESILFDEKVISIKEISKNIVLENCHFTPTRLSKPLHDGASAAFGGILSLDGVIVQNIRYSELDTQEQQKTEPICLLESILLELKIQLLQQQEMHIKE